MNMIRAYFRLNFLHSSIHTTVLELLLFPTASVRRTLSCDTSAQILCDICNSKTCVINCLHLSFVKILLAQCVVSFADYSSHSNTGGFFLLTAKVLLNPRAIRGIDRSITIQIQRPLLTPLCFYANAQGENLSSLYTGCVRSDCAIPTRNSLFLLHKNLYHPHPIQSNLDN